MQESPTERPARAGRRDDWLLWIAPLVAIAGFASYWTLSVRSPFLRDTGLLNLALLLVAVALSVLGVRRAWSRGWLRRVAGAVGVVLSTALLGLFVAYCYVLSYQLPSADGAVAVGERLPPIALTASDGSRVDLAEASRDPLVLVFYRGFW